MLLFDFSYLTRGVTFVTSVCFPVYQAFSEKGSTLKGKNLGEQILSL